MERYPIDYLKQIDAASLEETDVELYESLAERLNI